MGGTITTITIDIEAKRGSAEVEADTQVLLKFTSVWA